MIIATTMLAVPASAFALSGVTSAPAQPVQNPVQTTLNLRVIPHRVQFGDPVTLSGTAPSADAGRRVLLQTAPSATGRWHALGTATVGRSGGFRARITPHRSGLLRAVESDAATLAPQVSAGAATGAGGARQSTVTVGARFTPAHHETAVLSTHPIKVGGKLLPALAGRSVRLQSHTRAGWRTLGTGRTGARGGYRVRLSPSTIDGRRLRLVFAGDRGNARAVRPAGTVTVLHPALASWYEDGGSTACGFHAGLGVANRTLPCGTRVTLRNGGRTVTAVVDDRGPFAGGREWDLNQNTAAALGFAGVGTVWSSE